MIPKTRLITLIATLILVLYAQMTLALATGAHKEATDVQSDVLEIDFVLRTAKEKQLKEIALAAANPDSAGYGRYLSMEEILAAYGPNPGVAEKVVQYLAQRDLTAAVDATGLYVKAQMTVKRAEKMTGVTLSRYVTADGSQSFLAPDSAAKVPKALEPYVEALIGLDQTSMVLPPKPAPESRNSLSGKNTVSSDTNTHYNSATTNNGTPSGCPDGVSGGGANPYTPNQWLHAYGLDQLHAAGYTGQGERLALIESDGFYQSDLDGFTDCFGLSRQTPVVTTVPGGPPIEGPGGETMLDLQVLAAAAPGLDQIQVFESTDGQGNADASGRALTETYLAAISQPPDQQPTVVSISLAICEASSNLMSASLMEKGLRRAAAAGISVFVSSSDQGVTSCRHSMSLEEGNATNAYGVVSAGYPATSPWVTAVGGTNLRLNSDNAIMDEIVWNNWGKAGPVDIFGTPFEFIEIFAGTGGLSAWFEQPTWQSNTYIGAPAYGPFEKARAVPDVALLADATPGYAYFKESAWSSIGGTSAATPLMAGAVAVMNQVLRSRGKWRLGYLNPLLYRLGNNVEWRAEVYNDVTVGDNDTTWAVFPGGIDAPSFSAHARPGYDPASGWGSPKFPQFLERALNLQKLPLHR